MAYRNSYNYKGGSKKVRDTRRVKRGLRIAGRAALWLFVGMLITHLIFSVASRSKETLAELDSQGIPPISSRTEEINSQLAAACWCGGDFTDSYATDRMIALLKRKGITAAVLDVKPESGALAFASELASARRFDAVPEGVPELDRIVVKFKNAGIRVIARISLYIDDLAATDLKHCAVESREVTEVEVDEDGNETTVVRNEKVDAIWRDKNGHAWRSPFDESVVEYTRDLIVELAQGGVDAVLIDNVRFPIASDGDGGTVIFPDEESAELPRAGAVRQNIALLYSAAQSEGIELCVAIDAAFCCGEQDQNAGITFNVFGVKADVICPIAVLSRFAADGVVSVGGYAFEEAQSADLTELFGAICRGLHMMQGALDDPPAVMPFIQAYSDEAAQIYFSPSDVKAQTDELDNRHINGRIFYGPADELDRLLPDVYAGSESGSDGGSDGGSESESESSSEVRVVMPDEREETESSAPGE